MSLRLKRTQKLQVVFFGKKKDNLLLLLGSYFRFGSLILQYKYFPEHYFIRFKKGPNITLIPSVQWSGKTSRTSGTEPHNSRNNNIQFCGYKIIFPWLEPNNNHGSNFKIKKKICLVLPGKEISNHRNWQFSHLGLLKFLLSVIFMVT